LEDFIFHESDPWEVRAFDFEPTLFHNPEFLALKGKSGWRSFVASHLKQKKVVVSLFLHVEHDVANSSRQSPFGNIEFSSDILPETLYKFLEFVEGKLRLSGIRKIVIKASPFHYDAAKSGLLQTFLFNKGYKVVEAEVDAILPITASFEDGLNRLETRHLKKCLESDLRYIFHPVKELENIYSFIHSCRQRKGYPLSMTSEELLLSAGRFPDRYLPVGVYYQNELIAASIAVRITSDILYNFYADHAAAYDHLSPVVFVVKALHDYCQKSSIRMLDMGTSALDRQPNFGLLNFKLRLGGIPTPKLTFEKTVEV